uniref:Uncharacterized protein n=1 Tax=Arundo donax TaxID=35708 RepID=A0A0A9FG01_ARUDO
MDILLLHTYCHTGHTNSTEAQCNLIGGEKFVQIISTIVLRADAFPVPSWAILCCQMQSQNMLIISGQRYQGPREQALCCI